MNKKRVFPCVLVGAGLALWVGSWSLAQSTGAIPRSSPYDSPQDATPDEIAESCIAKATKIADRSIRGNEITADRSVAIITQLLEVGQVEDARCVARWSIFWINNKSARRTADIERLCKRSVHAIIRAGGTRELVEHVKAVCHEQIKRVADSRDTAIGAILAVLPEPEAAPVSDE